MKKGLASTNPHSPKTFKTIRPQNHKILQL